MPGFPSVRDAALRQPMQIFSARKDFFARSVGAIAIYMRGEYMRLPNHAQLPNDKHLGIDPRVRPSDAGIGRAPCQTARRWRYG